MTSSYEKYRNVFGSFAHLSDDAPWTEGVAGLVEWILWEPRTILGVSKADYWKQVITWASDPAVAALPMDKKFEHIKDKLDAQVAANETQDRYARRRRGIAGPREALRRAKFFSEDYLNKEFDIFWNLASDRFLDAFYGKFTTIAGGGSWTSRGNGGLVQNSVELRTMQADNLSYSRHEKLLVANELKLDAAKNADQMLKYAHLHLELKKRGFIDPDDRLLLLFIAPSVTADAWGAHLDAEIRHCEKHKKLEYLLAEDVLAAARATTYASVSWTELADFCDAFAAELTAAAQTEQKLLRGFANTVRQKNGVSR